MSPPSVTEIIIEESVRAGIPLLRDLITWAVESEFDASSKRSARIEKMNHQEKVRRYRQKLGHPIAPLDDGGDWETLANDLDNKTTNKFIQLYSYSYNGANSSPPNAASPDEVVVAFKEFVSCPANDSGQLQLYIDGTIVRNPLPDFYQKKMQNDMLTFLKPWLSAQSPGFLPHQFQSIYPADPADLNQSPLAVDAAMYWTNTMATNENGDSPVQTLFLSYCGVYYRGRAFWKSTVHHPLAFTGGLPVMRIALAVSTVLISTALSAFVYQQKPKSVKLIVTVLPPSLTFIATQTDTKAKNGQLASPEIDISWLENALATAGITTYTSTLGVASVQEASEFQMIEQWEGSNYKA